MAQMATGAGFVTGKVLGGHDPVAIPPPSNPPPLLQAHTTPAPVQSAAPPPPPTSLSLSTTQGFVLPGQQFMFPNDPATQLRNVANVIPQGGLTAMLLPHYGPADDWDAGGLREAWDQLKALPWHHPGAWLEGLWTVLKGVGGYVVWNYADFVRQWQLWNGEPFGLFRPLWRTLVTIVLTWGLVEVSTVVQTLWDVLRMIWEVLRRVFVMGVDVAEVLWRILSRVGESVVMVWDRVFG